MVRVGIVGTSWWADGMYLPALKKHPQAEVIGVCGRDYTRLQEFAKRWDIPCTYTDWRELISSGEIEALIVASSDDTHYPIAMMALDAGLHVLCDKPLAITGEQAHEMARKANEKHAITMVPFTYRYMPTTRYCKQLIDAGFVGKPYHLNMRYYTAFARGGDYDWRFDASITGSGVVSNLGTHWLHLARWFYGEIVGLSCYLDRLVPRQNRPDGSDYPRADDSAVMTVKFANGAYGVLEMIAAVYEGTPFGQTHHMEFHGSDGTLYNHIDWDTVQTVKGVKDGGTPELLDVPESLWNGARRDTVHNTYRDIFREQNNMTREFITAVANKQPAYPDFNEGARVQALVDAAIKSANTGCCWVEV